MLFATWRDSLLMTLLYVSQGFVYGMNDLQSLSQWFPETLLFYGPLIQPVLILTTNVLLFAVAALRIIAISNWLSHSEQ